MCLQRKVHSNQAEHQSSLAPNNTSDLYGEGLQCVHVDIPRTHTRTYVLVSDKRHHLTSWHHLPASVKSSCRDTSVNCSDSYVSSVHWTTSHLLLTADDSRPESDHQQLAYITNNRMQEVCKIFMWRSDIYHCFWMMTTLITCSIQSLKQNKEIKTPN